MTRARHLLIFVLLSSVCYAGPFGLDHTMTKKDLEKSGIKLKPKNQFTSIILSHSLIISLPPCSAGHNQSSLFNDFVEFFL